MEKSQSQKLRDELLRIFHNTDWSIPEQRKSAKERANVAGKVISGAKSEIVYQEHMGEKRRIEYFDPES